MRFRLFRTEITVSFPLLCLLAAGIISGVLQGFWWCAAAIIIHESGHLLAMIRYGYFPERIKITLFQITVSDPLRPQRRGRENFWIIFFGPFANFICVIPLYLLYLKGFDGILPFAAANLSVGLFNLLPVLSLDGGQLLYLLLSRRLSQQRAENAVNITTFVLIFPLAALGFLLLLRSKRNISLLLVSVYLVFSLLCRDNRYY